jgi:hypothetical protein
MGRAYDSRQSAVVSRESQSTVAVESRPEPRTPNAERRTPNAERRTPNAERRTPNAERRAPNAERRTPSAGSIMIECVLF